MQSYPDASSENWLNVLALTNDCCIVEQVSIENNLSTFLQKGADGWKNLISLDPLHQCLHALFQELLIVQLLKLW